MKNVLLILLDHIPGHTGHLLCNSGQKNPQNKTKKPQKESVSLYFRNKIQFHILPGLSHDFCNLATSNFN